MSATEWTEGSALRGPHFASFGPHAMGLAKLAPNWTARFPKRHCPLLRREGNGPLGERSCAGVAVSEGGENLPSA